MLTIYFDDKTIKSDANSKKDTTLYIAKSENRDRALKQFGLNKDLYIQRENTCFESHKDFDYLFFLVPNQNLTDLASEIIEVFLTNNIMLAFYEGESSVIETWVNKVLIAEEKADTPQEMLLSLLNVLSARHINYLEEIEDEITDLEIDLAKEETKDYVSDISALRKQLLTVRRYYENMLDLLENLEENRNNLFSEDYLRLLHFQTQRVERLYRSILNLRDYLTQVREGYQAMLDIEANKVMKLFTVITSIFLPLTLLAGWYGMNIKMPEFAYPYTYPIVILVSFSIVGGLIYYFKRNNWF